MKKFSEIMIEVDNTFDYEELKKLHDEFESNRYQYPLVQVRFAREHFKEQLEIILESWKVVNLIMKQITNL